MEGKAVSLSHETSTFLPFQHLGSPHPRRRPGDQVQAGRELLRQVPAHRRRRRFVALRRRLDVGDDVTEKLPAGLLADGGGPHGPRAAGLRHRQDGALLVDAVNLLSVNNLSFLQSDSP